MFILSIIPVPITMDSDGNSTNNNISALATAEQKVKELEALYTTLITGIIIEQDLYFNPIAGVNYGDQASVKQQLDNARAEVQKLIAQGQGGTEDAADIQARLAEVTRRLPVADQRINDLTALLNAINSGKTLTDANGRQITISGVNNTDAASVQREIDKAIAYKNELNNIQTFWQALSNSRMQANQQGDINMDGLINNNDLTLLQSAVSGSIQLNDVQKKAADMNGDGIIDGNDFLLLSSKVNPSSGSPGNTTTNTNIITNTTNTNPINVPPLWQFYTGEEAKLARLEDVKMMNDIAEQKATSEQKIIHLEGVLQSLKGEQSLLLSNEEKDKEIWSTQQDLNREKVRLDMLSGLLSNS